MLNGPLSSGMVLTDFLLSDMRKDEKARRNEKMFNILADGPGTVAAFLAAGMLWNTKYGAHIAWLTSGKIMRRLMGAMFVKRDIVKKYL